MNGVHLLRYIKNIHINIIKNHYKKAISRDTWQQFYEFTQTIKTDFSNFDFEGAWPGNNNYIFYCLLFSFN